MLQKFFFNLYTALIGLFDKGKPRLVDLAFYRESIFNPVGLWTLVAAAGLAMIFYFVVNGKDTAAYLREYGPSRPKWLLTLLLAAGTGAGPPRPGCAAAGGLRAQIPTIRNRKTRISWEVSLPEAV